jgi:hypothetical protein
MPLLFRYRKRRGVCADRKSTRGATVLRPKALSQRSTVWRLGNVRKAFTRCWRAAGISERRRPVKMSAKFATCSCVSCGRLFTLDKERTTTYLQALLGLQHFGQRLTRLNAECVAQESDFLDIVVLLQGLNVWLDVLGGRELEALAFEGEKLRHVGLDKRKRMIAGSSLQQPNKQAGAGVA